MNEDKKPLPDFVVEAPATIEWPVTVTHPVDGGAMAAFRFTGVFKRLSEEQIDALLGKPEQTPPAPASTGDGAALEYLAAPLAPVKLMADTLRENVVVFKQILVGWRGPKHADGTDAAFTAERLEAATTGPNGPFFSAGIWQAVAEIRHGARLGN